MRAAFVVGAMSLLGFGACEATPELLGTDTGVAGARGGKADRDEIPADWLRGIAATALVVDLEAMEATAQLRLDPADGGSCETGRGCVASFEAAGLDVREVLGPNGPLDYERREGDLHVVVGAADSLTVRYGFKQQDPSQGLGPAGSTSVWPTYCGNLFPCHSDPWDGTTFELTVVGVSEELTAIYPERITTETPAYTLAFATGKYECQVLGETRAGTEVSVCWVRKVGGGANGPRGKALRGTESLTAVFDWLEASLGAYAFGDEVASVSVDWGDGAVGGMEHHPFWHVSDSEIEEPLLHAHEAAHGWFGAGVRIACWEDLVLSEGTVSYLAARAIGAASGAEAEQQVWVDYAAELEAALVEEGDQAVLPATCGEVDVLEGLWGNVLYMKGAFFFRDYGDAVGHDVLVEALGAFYRERVGTAARTTELLEHLERATGADTEVFAAKWLTGLGNPLAAAPCDREPCATP